MDCATFSIYAPKPISYVNLSVNDRYLWEDFARLILEASYEATICTAILNSHNTGNHCVFLTHLGGGAFGNPREWITRGIIRALQLYKDRNLDIAIVSYGGSQSDVRQLIDQFSR